MDGKICFLAFFRERFKGKKQMIKQMGGVSYRVESSDDDDDDDDVVPKERGVVFQSEVSGGDILKYLLTRFLKIKWCRIV